MSADTTGGHPDMDYGEANRTYARFIKLSKFAIVFLVLLLLAMFYFLV
jgi:hypothetical protein